MHTHAARPKPHSTPSTQRPCSQPQATRRLVPPPHSPPNLNPLLAPPLQLDFLKESGFADPAAVGRKYPRYFANSLESKLKPTLEYVLSLGRSVDDVQAFPQVLGYSIDYLRKRHRFLELHGKLNK